MATENGWRGFDAEAADSDEFLRDWYYLVGIKRFVHLPTRQELDREQVDARHAHLFKKDKASDHVLRNKRFRKIDGVTYWPGKKHIVVEEEIEKFNRWQPPEVQPRKGAVGPFLEHVQYLFVGDKEAVNILLDYLAFQVQFPGVKVNWALLIKGPPGNGKSYLCEVMNAVLGSHNVHPLGNEELHENYSHWAAKTQFVVVEEMMAGGRFDLT